MHWSAVGFVVGIACLGLAGTLLVPMALAFWLQEAAQPFAVAALASFAIGAVLIFPARRAERNLTHRDAFLTVSFVWLSACAIGALPLVLHPTAELAPIDALFESVSGFTTTGATVISGLDALPRSVLLWRSIMQWLGGMGIVVFGVAVLPLLGIGGMQLYKAEAPGPTKDKMTPRVAETARLLWSIYLGLTLTAGVVFFLGGMSAFDAVNHAMTSVATAGFSTHDNSLGHYDSTVIHITATVAMLAGGTSFALLRRFLTGGVVGSEQPELRAYAWIFVIATLLMTVDLLVNMGDVYTTPFHALEHASFQAASILTTTGYSTTDFASWPGVSLAVLLGLFFTGGMAGSTAGGVKVIRLILMWRIAAAQFTQLVRPRAVVAVRLGSVAVDDRALLGTIGFIAIWLALLSIGTLALCAGGTDLMSSFIAAAVSLGNVGPGLAAVGPSETYAPFGTGSKLILEALMLLGRLEIYALLVVLTPGFWRY